MSAVVVVDPKRALHEILIAIRKRGGARLPEGKGSSGKGGAERFPPSVTAAAADLGVSVLTLRRWLRDLGVRGYSDLARLLGQENERAPVKAEKPRGKKGTKEKV